MCKIIFWLSCVLFSRRSHHGALWPWGIDPRLSRQLHHRQDTTRTHYAVHDHSFIRSLCLWPAYGWPWGGATAAWDQQRRGGDQSGWRGGGGGWGAGAGWAGWPAECPGLGQQREYRLPSPAAVANVAQPPDSGKAQRCAGHALAHAAAHLPLPGGGAGRTHDTLERAAGAVVPRQMAPSDRRSAQEVRPRPVHLRLRRRGHAAHSSCGVHFFFLRVGYGVRSPPLIISYHITRAPATPPHFRPKINKVPHRM